MTKPTHTHIAHGGRFAWVGEQQGGGALEGQTLVCYLELDKDLKSITTLEDWRQHWRKIEPDDCTVCMGTGRDSIKGNAAKPCGGCYGLGKVRASGEAPAGMWQLAEIAGGIIARQRQEIGRLRQIEAMPEVREILDKKRDAQNDTIARQEQKWRAGRGHGPGGVRYTGD